MTATEFAHRIRSALVNAMIKLEREDPTRHAKLRREDIEGKILALLAARMEGSEAP